MLVVGPGRQFATPQAAHNAAQPGDIIMIDAEGTYFGAAALLTITVPNLTIRGFNGRPAMELPYQDFHFENRNDPQSRHQQTRAIMGNRTAMWIVESRGVVIENIELFGAATNTNAANPAMGISVINNIFGYVTVRDIHIHRCEMAFHVNAWNTDIVIERSEFSHSGERGPEAFVSMINLRARNVEISHSYFHSLRQSESVDPTARTGTHIIASRTSQFVMRYSRLGDVTPCTYRESFGHARTIRFYEQGDIYLIGNIFYSKYGGRGAPSGHSGSGIRPIDIGQQNATALAGDRGHGRRLFVINNTFMSDNTINNVPIDLYNPLWGTDPRIEEPQILVANNIFGRDPSQLHLRNFHTMARFVGHNVFTGRPGQCPDIFYDRYYGRDPRIIDTPEARALVIGQGVNPNEIAAQHGFTHAIDICLIPRYVFTEELGVTERRPLTGGVLDIGAYQFVSGDVDCGYCYDFGCIICQPELFCPDCEELLDDCTCCELCDNEGCIECQPELFCEFCEYLLDDCVCPRCPVCDLLLDDCTCCELCDNEGCIVCQPELFCPDCEYLLDDCVCEEPPPTLVVSGSNVMHRIDYAAGDVVPDNNGIIEWRTDLTLTQRAGGPAANADSRISISMIPQGYTGRPNPQWYSHNDSPIQLRTTTIGNNWQIRTNEPVTGEWGTFYIAYLWDDFRMIQGVTYEFVVIIDVDTFYVTYQLWEGEELLRDATFEMSDRSGNPGSAIPNNYRELFVDGLETVFIWISHNTNPIPSIFTLENYTLTWPEVSAPNCDECDDEGCIICQPELYCAICGDRLGEWGACSCNRIMYGYWTRHHINYAPGDIVPDNNGLIIWSTDINLVRRSGGPDANDNSHLTLYMRPQGQPANYPWFTQWAAATGPPIAIEHRQTTNAWVVRNETGASVTLWPAFRMTEGVDYQIVVTIDTDTFAVTYELWEGDYQHRVATHTMPPAHRGAFTDGLASATFVLTGDRPQPSVYRISNWTLTFPDATEQPNLVSIINPSPISITRAQAAAGEWGLPATVSMEVTPIDALVTADVSWGVPSPAFDPSNSAAQTLTFTGTVTLPDGITNTDAIPLTATATVSIPAETLLTLTAPTDVTLSQAVADYEAVIALLPDTVNVTTTGATTSLPINWSFTGTFDAAAGAQNTFTWTIQLGGILPNGVTTYGTIVVTNYTPASLPVFSWSIFNNGPGGTQYPRPNAGLAASGTIRMWTQLDGVGAPAYLAAADTIVALDQDGECARGFVTVNRVWVAGQGWADYFNQINVNKNGNWQYINLYITVYGRVVNVLLVNALFEEVILPEFSWDIINNGPGGTQYPRPNASLAASGIIRMWTQLDSVNTPVYLAAADTIVALDQDGDCAMEFVRVSRVWVAGEGWADYFSLLDVNQNGDWQHITLSITVYGQTMYVLLVNALFEATPVEPQIVSLNPSIAVVERGGVVEIVVTTQGMPDGAWVDLNVAWRAGLTIVGGPRFYIVDNQAIITVAAAENAGLGRDGFSVTARVAGEWGSTVIIDSYTFVIEVV